MTNSGVVVAKRHTNISLSQGGSSPSYLLACKASNMLGFAPANVESTSCCVFIIQLYGPFILVHMDSLSVLTSQAALYPIIAATLTDLGQRIKNWKSMTSFSELRKLYPLRQINMDEHVSEGASFRIDRTLVEALFNLQIYRKEKPLVDCENLHAMWKDCDTCWKRLEEKCMRNPLGGPADTQILREIYQFAQSELRELKERGTKGGLGSVDHPMTKEKISRSKHVTGCAAGDGRPK